MDLTKMALFSMAKSRMDWLAQRQSVLAQNIANANTPEYQPQDLRPLDFRRALRQTAAPVAPVQPVATSRTHAEHLPGTAPEKRPFREDAVRRPYETSPDGNQVVLEEQMLKVSQTRNQYTVALNLFQKNLKMLRISIGKGGN